MPMDQADQADQAEPTADQVLKRDIPWEMYTTSVLINGTGLQLLRRYDKKADSYRMQLLDDDGPAYVRVFVSILRNIFKEETVEYVLALVDEVLTSNPMRARLFHDRSLAEEDTYEPFLRLLWRGNWFVQEKSCRILCLIVSARPKAQDAFPVDGEASKSKMILTSVDDVLKGVVEWLCGQLKKPSHPSRSIQTAIYCLAILLEEPEVRSSFVKADAVKLLVPFISPASTQQSIQLLYETCRCILLLSYYKPAVEHLAAYRALPRLMDVVEGSTKEKVVRLVVLTFKNLLSNRNFGSQMVDLGLAQIVQNLKAQAWSDEDLLEALNQLEGGLKDNTKKWSYFEKYRREVFLGPLDWSPIHKDPNFWRENVVNFEEYNFQTILGEISEKQSELLYDPKLKLLRALLCLLNVSCNPRTLAVACFDLAEFIQYHSYGRAILNSLNAKKLVMNLLNHENAEVAENALLCFQRLSLDSKLARRKSEEGHVEDELYMTGELQLKNQELEVKFELEKNMKLLLKNTSSMKWMVLCAILVLFIGLMFGGKN